MEKYKMNWYRKKQAREAISGIGAKEPERATSDVRVTTELGLGKL